MSISRPARRSWSNSNCGCDDLAYVQPDLSDRADPGVYDLWIAPSAAGGEKTSSAAGLTTHKGAA